MAKPRRPRPRSRRPRFERLEARGLLTALGPSAVTVFTVTSSADTITGSTLRAAILAADAATTPYEIKFDLPTGSTTIQPTSPLPTITATGLLIDGTSQPGYSGAPTVVIDGSQAGSGANGLTLVASGVLVEGLAIGDFAGSGVSITGPGSDLISASYIGVDAAGTAAAPNGIGVSVADSPNNTIGGLVAGSGLISGNTGAGVQVSGSLAKNNVIRDAAIGTDAATTKAIPNGVGVSERGASSLSIVSDVISGNTAGGVSLASGSGSALAADFIGTDRTGGVAVGNGQFGVQVSGESGDSIGQAGYANVDVVSGNAGTGVLVTGSSGTAVVNSFIGLDRAGTAAMGNAYDGVEVTGSSSGTRIGGPSGSGNFLGGNTGSGIDVQGSAAGTVIQGNDIGSDVTGQIGVPNAQNGVQLFGAPGTVAGNLILDNGVSGVLIDGGSGSAVRSNVIGDVATGKHGNGLDGVFVYGSSNNTIGGAGAGNDISGNAGYGVTIEAGSSGNVVAGNFVGLTLAGAAGVGNDNGVAVFDSTGNTIGGTTAASGNYIGSNTNYGIDVHGTDATGNLVVGNIVGLGANNQPAPNARGIILDDAKGVLVQRNIISANTVDGIVVYGGSGSTIQANLIGTDTTGTRHFGNGGDGVDLYGASYTLVGGPSPADRNTIAANGGNGVDIRAGGGFNVVEGDWIGLDLTGTRGFGNGNNGVLINDVPGTTVGGSAASPNFIDNNAQDGVQVVGSGATGTRVINSAIGLAPDGVTAAANKLDGVLVQGAPGVLVAYNYVSENTDYGVHIAGSGSAGAAIVGNLIGTDTTGTLARGNGLAGVLLDNAPGVLVGGLSPASRNIISGNDLVGVFLFGPGSTGDRVAGNFIGVGVSGRSALGNLSDGVLVESPNDLIGGPGGTNVISGNGLSGVHLAAGATGDTIASNRIGTDAAGLIAVGNGSYGVFFDGTGSASAGKNLLGGGSWAEMNLISGNGYANVLVLGANTSGDVIQGDVIGSNLAGTLGLGQTQFGVLVNGSSGNVIGGTTTGQGDVIAGNLNAGIDILGPVASGNLAVGDFIGRGQSADPSLANGIGVVINGASNNVIGGTGSGQPNLIVGNTTNTIQVVGSGATGNQTSGNIVGPNA